MSLKYPLRVKQTTSTTGTGSLTLLSPDGSTRSFQAHFGSGPVKVCYVIDGDGYFEYGNGTFTAPTTLTRDTVIASSNSGALVSLPAATANVFADWPGGRGVDQFSATTTLDPSQRGNVLEFTGSSSATLNLPALSTLPLDGFEIEVDNDGTATLTLDAAGADTIGDGTNDAGTLALPAGVCGILYKGVSEWKFRYFSSAAAASGANAGVLVGAKNPRCSVATAAATAAFTADQIVCGQSLSGTHRLVSAYSQTVNLGTTGAGGMDTGSAPLSGYVAVYAITNDAGGVSILACNITASSGEVYTGAHMPAAYTYSALLGIWPTNGSGNFVIGFIEDRNFTGQHGQVVSGGTASSVTSVALTAPYSAGVPPSAKRVRGYGGSGGDCVLTVSASSGTAGQTICEVQIGGGIGTVAVSGAFDLPIITAQTIYYVRNSGSGTVNLFISGYQF